MRCLGASVDEDWRSIVGNTQPQRRAIAVRLHGHTGIPDQLSLRKKSTCTMRRCSRLCEAECRAVTSWVIFACFDFCAITSLYLLRELHSIERHNPWLQVACLSCDVKGVSSPHSRTASTSEGSRAGAWYWTCLFF